MAWWPVLAPAPLPGWLPAVDEGEGESGAAEEEEAPSRGRGRGCTPMCAQVHLSSQLSSRLVTHLPSRPADLLQLACAGGRQEGDPGSVPRDSQRSQGHRARVPQPSCQHWSHTSRHTRAHTHAAALTHTCVHTSPDTRVHTQTPTGVHTLAPGLKHTFAHTLTHMYPLTYTHVHIHILTHVCVCTQNPKTHTDTWIKAPH